MVILQEDGREIPFLAFPPVNEPKCNESIFGRSHSDGTDKHLAYNLVYFRSQGDREAMGMEGEKFDWCCRIDSDKVEQAHRR